jgi:hypothetical protein
MHSKPILDAIMEQTKCSAEQAQDAMHDAIESAWRTHCPAPAPSDVVHDAYRKITGHKRGDREHLRYMEPDAVLEMREKHQIGETAAFNREQPRFEKGRGHDGPGLCDRCGARIYWVPLNDHAAVHTLRVPGGRVTVSEGARFYMRCEIIKGDTPGSTYPHPRVNMSTGGHVRHVGKVRTVAKAPQISPQPYPRTSRSR